MKAYCLEISKEHYEKDVFEPLWRLYVIAQQLTHKLTEMEEGEASALIHIYREELVRCHELMYRTLGDPTHSKDEYPGKFIEFTKEKTVTISG